MRALYSQRGTVTTTSHAVRMIQNLVLTNLGQMALILLNYRYSPNGHIGVNASIRPHSTHTSLQIGGAQYLFCTVARQRGCAFLHGCTLAWLCVSTQSCGSAVVYFSQSLLCGFFSFTAMHVSMVVRSTAALVELVSQQRTSKRPHIQQPWCFKFRCTTIKNQNPTDYKQKLEHNYEFYLFIRCRNYKQECDQMCYKQGQKLDQIQRTKWRGQGRVAHAEKLPCFRRERP